MAKVSRWTAAFLLIAIAVGVIRPQWNAEVVKTRIPAWIRSSVPERMTAWLEPRNGTETEASMPCGCESLADLDEPNSCHLRGNVVDCSCSYSAVEQMNRDEIFPAMEKLVNTAFFSYFKVDLYCECPFWPDDGMCSMRDCSVCECEDHEVPAPWVEAERPANVDSCAGAEADSQVDRTLQPGVRSALLAVRDWRGYRNPWMPEAGEESVDYTYVNLRRNPERYTGYRGEHAARVWGAIYGQQGLWADAAAAPELRVFQRLVSGVHSSISAHLSYDHLQPDGGWGPDLAEFRRRLGSPELRGRVENLYFAYLFVLRAVMKAEPVLRGAAYDTGLPDEDAATVAALDRLFEGRELRQACPIPFDEARLWRGEDGAALKQGLQATFRNITRVMDCVGCEKCKMWGKLQFLGLATSLKILFSTEDCTGAPVPGSGGLQLERNEVIALINLLERLSKSVEIVRRLSLELAGGAAVHPQGLGAIQDVVQESLPGQLRAGWTPAR